MEPFCDICRKGVEAGRLLTCCGKNCGVNVHPRCYGAGKKASKWYCDPCAVIEKQKPLAATKGGKSVKSEEVAVDSGEKPSRMDRVKCFLCNGYGGALKKLQVESIGRWAHVNCVMAFPETEFTFPKAREEVTGHSAMSMTKRRVFRCGYCSRTAGACLVCCVAGCDAAFHPRCALDAGLQLEMCLKANRQLFYCPIHVRFQNNRNAPLRTSLLGTSKARNQSQQDSAIFKVGASGSSSQHAMPFDLDKSMDCIPSSSSPSPLYNAVSSPVPPPPAIVSSMSSSSSTCSSSTSSVQGKKRKRSKSEETTKLSSFKPSRISTLGDNAPVAIQTSNDGGTPASSTTSFSSTMSNHFSNSNNGNVSNENNKDIYSTNSGPSPSAFTRCVNETKMQEQTLKRKAPTKKPVATGAKKRPKQAASAQIDLTSSSSGGPAQPIDVDLVPNKPTHKKGISAKSPSPTTLQSSVQSHSTLKEDTGDKRVTPQPKGAKSRKPDAQTQVTDPPKRQVKRNGPAKQADETSKTTNPRPQSRARQGFIQQQQQPPPPPLQQQSFPVVLQHQAQGFPAQPFSTFQHHQERQSVSRQPRRRGSVKTQEPQATSNWQASPPPPPPASAGGPQVPPIVSHQQQPQQVSHQWQSQQQWHQQQQQVSFQSFQSSPSMATISPPHPSNQFPQYNTFQSPNQSQQHFTPLRANGRASPQDNFNGKQQQAPTNQAFHEDADGERPFFQAQRMEYYGYSAEVRNKHNAWLETQWQNQMWLPLNLTLTKDRIDWIKKMQARQTWVRSEAASLKALNGLYMKKVQKDDIAITLEYLTMATVVRSLPKPKPKRPAQQRQANFPNKSAGKVTPSKPTPVAAASTTPATSNTATHTTSSSSSSSSKLDLTRLTAMSKSAKKAPVPPPRCSSPLLFTFKRESASKVKFVSVEPVPVSRDRISLRVNGHVFPLNGCY